MSDDLFAPSSDTEMSPATCGFIPRGGWPHKWARDAHRDVCSKCDDIESAENYKQWVADGRPEGGDVEG